MADYPGMTSVSAYFYGSPGGYLDKACRSIFEASPGSISIGAGTVMVGPSAGERDVQFMIWDDDVEQTRAALKKAGFRLAPTPT